MSKRKLYVIFKQFWTASKPTKWTEHATLEEAEDALKRLQASPSAEYNSYFLVQP